MPLTVIVMTTDRRIQKFQCTNEDGRKTIEDSLAQCARLFSNKSLIIAADDTTHVFKPQAVTRIEIESDTLLSVPSMNQGKPSIRSIDPNAPTPEPFLNQQSFAGKVDLYFENGDVLSVWIEGDRPTERAERLMNLTRIFDQPCVPYSLHQGGVGLINPATLIRIQLNAPLDLPSGSWNLGKR